MEASRCAWKRIMILIVYVSTTVFYYTSNYVGYMFRLLNSHLQAYSLQVKSQVSVHYSVVETCSLHNRLCNKGQLG